MAAGLRVVDGAAVGGWIAPELTGERGAVTGLVPDRYDAYVRILHPPSMHGDALTWAQVAAELGRTVHPLAQWDAIVGADRWRNEKPDWPGNPPPMGDLANHLLGPLLETLGEFTATPRRAFFGIWAGTTWGTVSPTTMTTHSTDDLSYAFSADEADLPPLALPRRYTVLTGSVDRAVLVKRWLSPSSPNLIWPEDRAWFLATEIEFDSTLVGGTEKPARRILEDGRLEAFPIGPRDLLTWDADKINPPLPG